MFLLHPMDEILLGRPSTCSQMLSSQFFSASCLPQKKYSLEDETCKRAFISLAVTNFGMARGRLVIVIIILRKCAFETIGVIPEDKTPPECFVECRIPCSAFVMTCKIMLWMEPITTCSIDKVEWTAAFQFSHILVKERSALQPLVKTLPYLVSPIDP